MANLRTGDRVLRLQSKKQFKHNVHLSNSYMTNLRYCYSLSHHVPFPLLYVCHCSEQEILGVEYASPVAEEIPQYSWRILVFLEHTVVSFGCGESQKLIVQRTSSNAAGSHC